MKIMAEVTVEMCDEDDNTDDEIEDGGKVGQLLEEEGDTSTKEKWQGLVRKLSVKRQKSRRKRRQKDDDTVQEEQGQDDVPEDWQPDFIPRKGQSGNSRGEDRSIQFLTNIIIIVLRSCQIFGPDQQPARCGDRVPELPDQSGEERGQ